jgi:hypothetical protein
MDTPGLFTVTDDWRGIESAQNVLDYVKDKHAVTLLRLVVEPIRGAEPYAVIVPIEQWRKMTDAED